MAQQRDLVAHPSDGAIDDLCMALLSDDREAAARMIARVERDGASHEAICLSYLAVAAQRLGQWWEDDRLSFVAVTLGTGRIYAILRGLKRRNPFGGMGATRFATFGAVPGDNHNLGVAMAAELLREKGWDIRLLVGLDHDAMITRLTDEAAPLVGLSAGGKHALPALLRLVVALRIASPASHILVCGQIAPEDVDLIKASGADFVTTDLDAAMGDMDRLIAAGANLV
jgi:methanogenic corrinoid protein MtbC1